MLASRSARRRARWPCRQGTRILIGLGIILLFGLFVFGQDEQGLEFVHLIIGELRVEFHQRMIDEAIVEGGYIVRQYDAHTGELVKEDRHWRADLPDELPDVISRDVEVEIVADAITKAMPPRDEVSRSGTLFILSFTVLIVMSPRHARQL